MRVRSIVLSVAVFALGAGSAVLAVRSGWPPSLATSGEAAAAAVAAAKPAQKEPEVLRFAAGAQQLNSLKLAPAGLAPVPLAEPLPGRIAYNENATARLSVPVAGRVVAIRAEPGDAVRAGAPLVVIDSPELASAYADVHKAGADEELKRKSADRARKLFEGEVLARKELDVAETDLRQSETETRRAKLRLRNLAPNGSTTESGYTLVSPLSGVVTERQVNPGMEVRPDAPGPLFVVSDPTRLWVIIDVPERSLAHVARGHPVLIEVDAWPKESFRGVIERIGEIVDPATRRVQVRAAIDNRDRRLRPEMYAKVSLLADEHRQAVRVPNSSLIVDGLYTYVFVEREPGVFVKRRIALDVQDREWSWVASGLAEGERVVVVGPLLLASELKSAD